MTIECMGRRIVTGELTPFSVSIGTDGSRRQVITLIGRGENNGGSAIYHTEYFEIGSGFLAPRCWTPHVKSTDSTSVEKGKRMTLPVTGAEIIGS